MAINEASRNRQTAELDLQMIKYADDLKNITSKEFCEGIGLSLSYSTELSKNEKYYRMLKRSRP